MSTRRQRLMITTLAVVSLASAFTPGLPADAASRRTIEGETSDYLVVTLDHASVMSST